MSTTMSSQPLSIVPPRYSPTGFDSSIPAKSLKVNTPLNPPRTPLTDKQVNEDAKEQAKPKAKNNVKDFNPYHIVMDVEESEADRQYRYPHLKPVFPNDIIGTPYEAIDDFVDRGANADKAKRHLLADCTSIDNMSVNIGTELKGIQLANLTEEQKDELALLVAERGVVVVRGQDLTPEKLVEFGSYFGAKQRPLHQHPSSGVPRQRGLDDVHVVWHDENMRPTDTAYTKTELWHTDVPFELNPPGLTALWNVTNPKHGGGDTLFSSCYGLYDALSPAMQEYLESLDCIQSGFEQAEGASKAGLHLRRPPVEHAHPLVRVHPVTGWKSVFVSPAFSKAIVGVPKHESDTILNMLYSLMAISPELTLRVRWEENTVVLWDNRIVNHCATYDHWSPSPDCRRHALRVASTAERPSRTRPDGSDGRSRQEAVWEEQGLDIDQLNKRARSMVGRKGGFKD